MRGVLDAGGLAYELAVWCRSTQRVALHSAELSIETGGDETVALSVWGARGFARRTGPVPGTDDSARRFARSALDAVAGAPDTAAPARPDLRLAARAGWRPEPPEPLPDPRAVTAGLHRGRQGAEAQIDVLLAWRRDETEHLALASSAGGLWQGARSGRLTGGEFALPGVPCASWRHACPGEVDPLAVIRSALPHVAALSDDRPEAPLGGPVRLSPYALAQVLAYLLPGALVFLPEQPPGLGGSAGGVGPVPDRIALPPGTAPDPAPVPELLHFDHLDNRGQVLAGRAAVPSLGPRRVAIARPALARAAGDARRRGAAILAVHLDGQDFRLPALDVEARAC